MVTLLQTNITYFHRMNATNTFFHMVGVVLWILVPCLFLSNFDNSSYEYHISFFFQYFYVVVQLLVKALQHPTLSQETFLSFKLLNKLLNVLIRIDRSILSLNFKQFHQMLCTNSLCIVDMTC